jgi:hypothetical protein
MLLAMIALLLATIPGDNVAGPPVDPSIAIDASCYGSEFRIGTGNVPMHNDRPTTIVNIWAELPPSSKTAIAWIAKNVSGQYWIQMNAGPAVDPQLPQDQTPRLMSSFTQYDSVFAKLNVATTPYFTNELPKTFYDYTTVHEMTFPTPYPSRS